MRTVLLAIVVLLPLIARAQPQKLATRDMNELNWMEFKKLVPARVDTVLVTVGTMEPHGVINNGADNTAPVAIAHALADEVNALVAPHIPYGVTGDMAPYPGALHVPEEVFRAYVHAVLDGMAKNGFRRIVVLNGHGGPQTAVLQTLLRDVAFEHGVQTLLINWWSLCTDETIAVFGEDGGHAGINETAFIQAIPVVIALHGGPGAPGYMAPLARALSDELVVLEPLQRPSGGESLTVARHVADLDQVVRSLGEGAAPALVGSSWGGMLALAYAAAHPQAAGPVVVIGSGTFDLAARARMHAILDERRGLSFDAKYTYEPIAEAAPPGPSFDRRANQETWDDMLRLQEDGTYPAAFRAIMVPVLMLHGAYDPHPGTMIRDGLAPFIAQLEYRQWERCGHYPWLERHARDPFYATLRAWLHAHVAAPA